MKTSLRRISMPRKIFGKGYSLRPHSFSSPLRPSPRDPKLLAKRNSNLSTVESIDLAWTWISASETANLSQDVSNLKLMLLKMRRLLDVRQHWLLDLNNIVVVAYPRKLAAMSSIQAIELKALSMPPWVILLSLIAVLLMNYLGLCC